MIKTSLLLNFLFFLLIASLLLPLTAEAADYLSDDSVPIAQHNRRRVRMVLPRDQELEAWKRWGRIFSADYQEQAKKKYLVSYRELPRCETPRVQLKEILRHSVYTDYFNVVYYDPRQLSQKRRAQESELFSVAYNPALIRSAKTGDTDGWQNLARFIGIECLPSRFRFTYIGSQRYMELREGELAWGENQ